MGVVYEAYNSERNERVAIKTLNNVEPDAIYRLKREFRSLAGVLHPNLVKMHELSCTDGQWFFVMDYVDGVPFLEYLGRSTTTDGAVLVSTVDVRRERPSEGLDADETVELESVPLGEGFYGKLRRAFGQLVVGVNALHAAGKVHRDLKPSNVLVSRSGQVVVLDFGLTSDAHGLLQQGSQEGLRGTPVYMAPELFTGEAVGPASDWYAVGVMLYQALVGRLPFRGLVHQLLSLKLFHAPDPPSSLVPGTPPEFEEVCLRLLARDPSVRPSGAELEQIFGSGARSTRVANSEARPLSGPFVGRTRELSALSDAFESVRTGKLVVATISGESGIGKTALVDAFLRRIRKEPDVTVLAGRCYEHESVPYKAFDQIADALSGYLSGSGEDVAGLVVPRDPSPLTTLFPVLARVPAIRASGERLQPADPTELRLRGFAAFAELLRRLASVRRLVIVVDDLQWSDADSALLFANVFGGREPPECLLIGTSRRPAPEALRELVAGASETKRARFELVELHLTGLSDEEASELARQTGTLSASLDSSIRDITAEARGNPFFVLALSRNAMPTSESGGSLPSFMRRWVKTLPPPTAEVLKLVALAGRPVDEAAVASAAGAHEIGGDLSLLSARHFIGAWPTPSRLIECYHDQIREAVLAEIDAQEERRLHGELARAIESRSDADVEQLATHYLAAGNVDKGSVYAERAGDASQKALAFLDAAVWYERALPGAAKDAERTRRLQTRLGEVLASAGRAASAARWFLEATRGAPTHTAVNLRHRAAELLLVSGHIDEGVRVLDDVLTHIGMRLAPTPKRALASFLFQRVRTWMRGLDFEERHVSQISEEELLRIDACWSVALGLGLVDTIRAADFQTRHLLLSLDSGEPYRVARALAMEAGFRATGGSSSEREAKEVSRAALELAERVGNPHAIGLATFTAGLGKYLAGRWKAAQELLSRAEQILIDLPGAIWEVNAAQRFQLNALAFLGDIPAIARRVPELVERARERGNLHAECVIRVRLSTLLSLSKDDPQGGLAETEAVMRRWSQEGFHMQHYNELLAHLNCALYSGRADEAMKHLLATWPKLERSLLLRTQALRVEAVHHRTKVCLAYLRDVGHDDTAASTLDRDIRALEREDVSWASACATLARALRYAIHGRRELAIRALERAERELRGADMELLATAAQFRRGRLIAGETGRAITAEARAWFVRSGVKHPERFLEYCAPG